MKVILAKSAGFCWGVRRAVEKACNLARGSHGPIYTDGPLIHNKQMMEQLRAEGVVETNDPKSISDGVLLIRAHGIPPDRRAMLDKLPVSVVDATCPDVAKIQGLIRKYSNNGYHVIIFGDVGHAEVIGLLGYAKGNAQVVSRPEDINNLPNMEPVCLVSQSTQFTGSYNKIADAVRRRFPNVEILDTICESTKNRQQELIEIAKIVDAIVVVGGTHSANTMRLVKLARTLKPTFHILSCDQINPGQFLDFKTAGLTAGASTPTFVVEGVRKVLEKL